MALRRGVSLIMSSPGPKGEPESTDDVMYNLDGTHLSLSDAKLTLLPSFLNKRHRGRAILEFVTSIDCSVNKIAYVPREMFKHKPAKRESLKTGLS